MATEMTDLAAPEFLSIQIDEAGKTLWINDTERCLLRAYRIGKLAVEDRRPTSAAKGYMIVNDGEAILCLNCTLVSFNPTDVSERYCGNCHRFFESLP